MDENQDLNNPLIINDENDIGAVDLVEQPTNVHLLVDLDNIDLSTILVLVGDDELVPKIVLEEDEEPQDDNNAADGAKSMRTSKKIENPDLDQLYQEIIMNKVFDKQFTMDGRADFVTSKEYEYEENDKTINICRLLVHNKAEHLIYISTFMSADTNTNNHKILRELPNFGFEYFEFTPDTKYIIIGNRGMIVMWSVEENRIIDRFQIPFSTSEEINDITNAGDIKNFNLAYLSYGKICIIYNIGKYIFKLLINVEYEHEMYVEPFKCVIEEEPRFLYVNTEEWVVVAVTSKKDSNEEAKESLQSIKVINADDMQISQIQDVQNAYFDEIYFKFAGNALNKSIKVIRKIENTLYLRTISIAQGEDLRKLIINFGNESAIMPEFFLKNRVSSIKNSIMSSLLISYTTSNMLGQSSRERNAIMDYNLKNEIKNLEISSDEAILFHEKLIFSYSFRQLKVFSLSKLKSDPILTLDRNINDIKISLPFIFITTDANYVVCYELMLDSKGTISPILTNEDIEVIDEKLSSVKKQHIIAALCHAKDSKNLQVYLDWKLENLTPENFEHLPLTDCIKNQSYACLDLLLEHILKINEDFPKMRIIYDEIEKNFKDIIESGCTKVPEMLDKFFVSNLEYGTPKSEFLPLYHTYDFRGSSLQGYFFGNPTENDKDYSVRNSLIKVPDTVGAGDSLRLTKCLCDIEDMKIFGTDFMKTYIRSKWSSLRAVILGLTILMWLNIYTVMHLVSKQETTYEYPLFIAVNILLVLSEIIQAINLGIEEYIGIYTINFLSVFQILLSIIMGVWFNLDALHFPDYGLYFVILFAVVQASTLLKYFHASLFEEYVIRIGLLCIPMILCMIIYIFTSNEFYFFIIIGVLELLIYVASYLAADILLGLRLGLQLTSVILFTLYSQSNIYLLIYNMILLASETGYLLKLINFSQWKKDHIIDYIVCFIVKLIVLLTFILPEYVSSYFALIIISCYTVYRSLEIYMQSDNENERMQMMAIFCFRYTFYILMAFYITKKPELLTAFILLNVGEFICHRSNSFKGLIDDTIQLIFNWNTMDIIRYLVSIYWVYYDVYVLPKLTKDKDIKALDNFQVLTWLFVFLNVMKALLGFRAFDQTRFYVRLIFKCMFEIIPFLIIFVFFTYSFGLLNIVEKGEYNLENIWASPFDQSVGGFQRAADGSWLGYFMFLLGTLIIVIIMLNLLISILGDTFSRFLVEAKQIDYKVMIETVYEVEVLLFWRTGTNSVKFFAICDNIIPTEEEIESAWQSKLDSLDKKLEDNKVEFQNIVNGLRDNINAKIEEIKDVLERK